MNKSSIATASRKALELCHQIEQCGASPELTQASILATELREQLARELDPPSSDPVSETKAARLAIKTLVEELQKSARKSRSRSLAITKLEEASMWLGKDLQELNEPNPYPNSHDPGNPKIDPTAPEACALPPKTS